MLMAITRELATVKLPVDLVKKLMMVLYMFKLMATIKELAMVSLPMDLVVNLL